MQESRRLKGLDGLKAFGCVAVAFFWHYQHFGSFENPPLNKVFFLFYQSGGIAVELFFMLSGFTMQMGYYDRINNHMLSFHKYVFRRMRKIYPLAMSTHLIVTVLELLHKAITGEVFVVQNFDLYHFVLNCFLLQSGWWENSYSFNTPAWFLSTLLLCYILYFVVVKLTSKDKRKFMLICFAFVLLGFTLILIGCELPFLSGKFAARGYLCFMGGGTTI